jgi:uncharacterized protein DUF6894
MTRYYFDLHNGDGPTKDNQGQDLATRAQVSKELARILIDVARDELPSLDRATISVTVRDENGAAVSVASLTFNNEWV